MKKIIQISGVLLCVNLIGSEASLALDFNMKDEDEEVDADEQMFDGQTVDEKSPEIDIDQSMIREARPHAVGVAFGEAIPFASNLVSYLTVHNNVNAYVLSIGKGKGTTLGQGDGESSFTNEYQNLLVDGSWLWWPAPQFPFAIQTGMAITSTKGTIQNTSQPKGNYQLTSVGVGSGLVMESFFENGIWIQWNLISGRYYKVFKNKFTGMTDKQGNIVKDNIDGFQIVGVANLTVGYSF